MSWIPVEERLPEVRGDYLVTFSDGTVSKRTYHPPMVKFDSHVIAWQPLPAPYVKPRRFVVEEDPKHRYRVVDTTVGRYTVGSIKADFIPTREAAETIADIYEEAYR